MEQKKQRNNNIDIVKGIMILSVVVYHLIYRPKNCMADRICMEFIYLSMPLFFLIAGYFYREREGSFVLSIWNRLKKVILPVIGVSATLLICFGPYYMVVYKITPSQWLGDIVTTYLRPELMKIIKPEFVTDDKLFNNISPIWFIWVLFFATILFYVCMEFAKKSNIRLVVTSLVLIAIGTVLYIYTAPLSWSLNIAPLYTGIMILGYLLKKSNVLEKLEKLNLGISCLIMIPAAVAHYFIYMNFGSDLIFMSILGDKGYLSAIFFVIQIFIGGYVLFTLSRVISLWEYSEKALTWVGRHTLVILLFHFLIAGITADALHTYNKSGPDWYIEPVTPELFIKSLITFVVALAGCIGLALLNDKLKSKFKK
ncbi:MAG: acyltransferase [Eubacterium sp.]|nr:acyltransferase [Eubacterium sp.]